MRQSLQRQRALRYVLLTMRTLAPSLATLPSEYDRLARDLLVDACGSLVMWAKDTRETSRRQADAHAMGAIALVDKAAALSDSLLAIGHLARAVRAVIDGAPAIACAHANRVRLPVVASMNASQRIEVNTH